MTDPYDLGRAGLTELFASLGEPAYRAGQVVAWLTRGVDDPTAMTDLPAALRHELAERFAPARPRLLRHLIADRGATHKFLLGLPDGEAVEAVLMLYPGRATVCVSTQAGCAMGCPFCATGQAGFRRQLTAGEIVRQVALAHAMLVGGELEPRPRRAPDHVTNVVFMGMGEPLANLAATEAAVRWLHGEMGLGARHLTVSTVGLTPGIRRLGELGLPITLAVSLHAADDALRDDLVPINRVHPLAELLEAVDEYRRITGRRVTFEYVLIGGVNDRIEHARGLARLARRSRAHVNVIPLNPTPGVVWREPTPQATSAFVAAVQAGGAAVTLRDTRGRDVDAACGQLLATYHLGDGRRLPVAEGAAARVDLAVVAR